MSAPTILPTAGFSTIDNEVLLNPEITIEAKATLALLKYFDRGRGCFCRKETLCRFLSVSPYRLRKALRELQELKLITITRPGQGHPDIIRVVRQEEPQEPLQVDVEEEMQEKLDHVAEELLEVAPDSLPDPQEESVDSERQDVEIQTDEISSDEHYINKIKLNNINTPCTKPDSIEPQNQATVEKQCDDLISHFYEQKEDREPTRNELINWRPTAKRLLSEFTFDELIPAVKNAVDQGARLFYFVALTGPDFILKRRQQRQAELHRARAAERGKAQEEGRNHRIDEVKATATIYASETADLIGALSQHVRPQILRSIFGDVFISAIDADSITLTTPSEIIARWIRERYGELLRDITGRRVEVVSV